ncbi:MAG TPA: amino acid adenylation domain-containing protein, partial [Flavitalea sp.]|nr:amino acid adenylation domain-containing protein [Flavitalea sp.]
VISRISKQFNVNLELPDIFLNPTIAGLAVLILQQQKNLVSPSAIVAENRPGLIPLSFSQERLWFIDQLEGSVQYHLPAVFRLEGKLDILALNNALQTVVNRHEVLRTVFRQHDGNTWQHINSKDQWKLSLIDKTSSQGRPENLESVINDLIRRPFDLSSDDMLRGSLITISDEEYVLVVTMHHIASDGWSTSVLVKEVIDFYNAYAYGQAVYDEPLELQYADYAIWQRKYLQGEMFDTKLRYWKGKLQGTSSLGLYTDFARPAVWTNRGAMVRSGIDSNLTRQLQLLSNEQGTTLFMTLLSAVKVLLHQYSGQNDVCLGTGIAGRQHQELENLIGFFVNTIALRSNIRSDVPFTEFLHEVKNTTIDAYANQEVPFEKVVDAVVTERDMSRNPLFQVMFVLQNTPKVPEFSLGDVKLFRENYQHTTAQFDLSFSLAETDSGIEIELEYCTDLYKAVTIERMLVHYRQLLQSIVTQPSELIGNLSMLSVEEANRVVLDFNNRSSEYPAYKSIVALFEDQVAKTPAATALIFEEQQFTYKELNDRSNQLAHYLRTKGVKKETLVPICIERSLNMMVGILGILKAGGVYVPLDPKYPVDRIRFMLGDIGASVAVSSTECRSKLSPPDTTLDIIGLDTDWSVISRQSADNLNLNISATDLAYIIYTSGSTGTPKGVMVEHRNVVSLVKGVDYISCGEKDAILSTGSFSFDATTVEYWGMLLNGGRLVLCTENTLLSNTRLKEEINRREVTTMWFTSSWFNQLVENDITIFERLETILVGGEKLSEQHIAQVREAYPTIAIINGYGPTENTTFSLTYNIKEKEFTRPIPIGRPLNNRSAYVLNSQYKPVPVGVAGEICLGGAGLSRGYLKREELTKEKFIPNPFEEGGRLYRTGDLGRWLPDGNIEYLGRLDDQVKIRGFRIELGEIESVVSQTGLVRQVVVVVKEDRQRNKRLVAYIVPEGSFEREKIITTLRDKLPEYMIPSQWVELEQLPLTSNGKVDKRALPEPGEFEYRSNEYAAPVTQTERDLAEIWNDIFGLKRVGIHDNFFELGGHSLLAMRLISRIRQDTLVEITIKDLFLNPTISQLSAHLDLQRNQGLLLPSIQKQPRPEFIPLSFSQERLWFIDLLEGSVQYHLPIVLRLKGPLNIPALKNALQQLINRHEALRTTIRTKEGQGYQFILPENGWQLTVVDRSTYKPGTSDFEQHVRQLISSPFDLARDHMVRGQLIRIADGEHMLVLTMHHIASDAWSVPIVVEEIITAYTSFAKNKQSHLTDLPVQYADYSLWQRSYLTGETLDKKLQYWKEKLDGLTPLQLPTDYARPAVLSTKGSMVEFGIPGNLGDQIYALAKKEGATLFMTLLAAFKVLLSRYSGQQDICVGSPVANRTQKEVEPLIGFFINSLALRSDLNNDPSFSDLLQQVKSTTLEAYQNQEVPFEKVVDAVVKDRDMSRSPLFQVMLVLENNPAVPELELNEIQISQEKFSSNTAKFELTLNIAETPGGLQASIEYSTDLYHAKTIQRMIGHYIELLTAIVQAPNKKISALSFLTKPEKHQLLHVFNKSGVQYPKSKTIVDLFETQAAKKPANIALVFQDKRLSYQELDIRSNQLAHYLKGKGVKQDSLVPICIERGLEMIVGLLGILKAGGAYVPVDPEYPEDRISYMVEDTAAPIVISSEESRSKIVNNAIDIVSIDGDWSAISKQSRTKVESNIRPENLAYVIYTSGSTGKPKGVLIEHRNVVRLFETDSPLYHFTESDVWTMFHSFCFDFSVWEIYGALFYGGRVVVVPKEATRDAERFSELLLEQNVTILNQTPSAFYVLQDQLVEKTKTIPIRYVIFGGEALNPSRLQPWKELYPSCRLVNMYGITETTVHVTYQEIEWQHINGSRSVIGKPIPTLTAYILDKDGNLLPSGVAGELHIGGSGLARGYLNRPDLTLERFINDPFSGEPGARLYRTGDLARWLPDGTLEYLGRIDEQVKIRGYRIELGEIESVLHECDLVSQAVVLAKQDKEGNKRLVGYIVPEGRFEKGGIISYLKGKLPDYMVPASWVSLESLPLTSNGKINKKVLPDPEASDLTEAEYVEPVTEEEIAIAGVWKEILNVERVGIHDNFFELGGDSIKVIRVVHKLKNLFNKEIRVFDIYHTATLSELARIIHAANETPTNAIFDSIRDELAVLKQNIIHLIPNADHIEDIYPMSDIQSGMVYAALLNPDLGIYHDRFTYYLSKDLNVEVFEKAISILVEKHSILRTAFNLDIHSEGLQIVYKTVQFKVEFINLEIASEEEGNKYVDRYVKSEVARPFEVDKAPVWRATIIKLKTRNAFIFQVHHALLDGWSVASFNTELNNLYFGLLTNSQAVSVTPLKATYKDFIIESIADKKNNRNNDFWIQEMSGYKRLNIFSQEPVSQKLNKTYPTGLLE